MTWRRIKLYLIGLGLGLLLSLVLFKGKSFESCSPASRVTGLLTAVKTIETDSVLLKKMLSVNLTQDTLRSKIAHGDIDFGRSNAQKEPCREYLIRFEHKGKPLEAFIALCPEDTTARLLMLEGI